MKQQQTAQATRARILNAAAQVIQVHGSDGLTLEAVAALAGVSKGGLLYHFPNKLALIAGMIEMLIQGFDLAIAHELTQDDDASAGHWLRAYIRATWTPAGQQLEMSAGLLAAVAADPALLDPLRRRYSMWHQLAMGDGLDPAIATMVRLALDGLWMADLFGLAAPDGVQRDALRALLLQLAGTAPVA